MIGELKPRGLPSWEEEHGPESNALSADRSLLEMKRRRCVREMGNLQKEIDEVDREIEVIELREQNEPLVSPELNAGLERIEQSIDRVLEV